MEKFLNPSSVALIGVPRATGVGSFNILENLLRFGYKGKIFPVNPKLKSLFGFTVYPDVRKIPEPVELAVIAVGRERVLDVMKGCAEKGTKRAIVITQGFSDADEKGKSLERKLIEIAKKEKIKIIGPNTLGVVNHYAPFFTSFVDIPRDPKPWPVSVICQSGVFQAGAESFTIKLGKAIDIGNASDVGFTECLKYFGEDQDTKIIVIHMEGIKEDGREFIQTASEISAKKPILVLKTAKSEKGKKIALSHTGSLAGENIVYKAAFKKAGIITVDDAEEIMDAVKAFLFLPPIKGDKIGIISFTGAGAIMMADACEDFGLKIANIPSDQLKPLQDLSPYWHRISNPVDIWPPIMWSGFEKAIETAFKIMIESQEVDGVAFIGAALSSPLHEDLDPTKALKKLSLNSKPVVAWFYGSNTKKISEKLEKIGIITYPSITRAIRALYFINSYRVLKSLKREMAKKISPVLQDSNSPRVLIGKEALEFIRQEGIPIVSSEMVNNENEALQKVEKLGYPLVAKLISLAAIHKTEIKGVLMNINSDEELIKAVKTLKSIADQKNIHLKGIMLQPMLEGVELIIGLKRDPQFGPVVLLGLGGIYAEILKDFSVAIAPVSKDEAFEMIENLKTKDILQGARGNPPIDKKLLSEILSFISHLGVKRPDIKELDINPLIASSYTLKAVDCRVILG